MQYGLLRPWVAQVTAGGKIEVSSGSDPPAKGNAADTSCATAQFDDINRTGVIPSEPGDYAKHIVMTVRYVKRDAACHVSLFIARPVVGYDVSSQKDGVFTQAGDVISTVVLAIFYDELFLLGFDNCFFLGLMPRSFMSFKRAFCFNRASVGRLTSSLAVVVIVGVVVGTPGRGAP